MADWAAIADGVMKGGNLIYNLFTNQRDFDYQKALQQQIFEREDTAIQRRMADLKAAGLNPNLAAGSAANAGSVVARSNTNDINPGSILDTLLASQQLKNSKVQQEILEKQSNQESLKEDEMKLNFYGKAGLLDGITYDFDSDKPVKFWLKDGINDQFWNTPFGRQLDYELMYNQNAAHFMEKQNNWFTTKMVSDLIFDSIGAGTSILKPNFMKGGRK